MLECLKSLELDIDEPLLFGQIQPAVANRKDKLGEIDHEAQWWAGLYVLVFVDDKIYSCSEAPTAHTIARCQPTRDGKRQKPRAGNEWLPAHVQWPQKVHFASSTLGWICFFSLDHKIVLPAFSDSQNYSYNLFERFKGEVAAVLFFFFYFFILTKSLKNHSKSQKNHKIYNLILLNST